MCKEIAWLVQSQNQLEIAVRWLSMYGVKHIHDILQLSYVLLTFFCYLFAALKYGEMISQVQFQNQSAIGAS